MGAILAMSATTSSGIGDSYVPSAQTLSVGGEVVATDGDTSADHGVEHRPSVSHHEYDLAVGEELLNV